MEDDLNHDGELWAVRHGQSTANEAFARAHHAGREDAGIIGRDADVPLSSSGEQQAARLRHWFKALPKDGRPQVVYVSPYLRARQTLQLLLDHVQPSTAIPVLSDERLRDRETGVLELLTPLAVERRYPQEAARRRRVGEVAYRPPGGESLWDVALRLRSFMRDVSDQADRRILLVGHDATVLMLRAVTEDLDEAEVADLMTREPVQNASVSHWRRTRGRWALNSYNVTTHLSSLPSDQLSDHPSDPAQTGATSP